MKQKIIIMLEKDIENILELRKIGLYSKKDMFLLKRYAKKIMERINDLED